MTYCWPTPERPSGKGKREENHYGNGLAGKRLAGALGAEVSGTDLTTTSGSDIERIKELLLEHKVLFFLDRPLVRRNT